MTLFARLYYHHYRYLLRVVIVADVQGRTHRSVCVAIAYVVRA